MRKLSDAQVIVGVSSVAIVLLIVLLAYSYYQMGVIGIGISLLICICMLQIYKIVYECYAARKKYNDKLVRTITRCYTIYCILNAFLFTVYLFSYLFSAAESHLFGWPDKVYFVIIVLVALIISILPYYSNIKHNNKQECNKNIVYDYVPRFVTFLFFVVYYGIKFFREVTIEEMLPAVFVIYLGIDRLVSLIVEGKSKAIEGYMFLYKDTDDWLKKKKQNKTSTE